MLLRVVVVLDGVLRSTLLGGSFLLALLSLLRRLYFGIIDVLVKESNDRQRNKVITNWAQKLSMMQIQDYTPKMDNTVFSDSLGFKPLILAL